jgi:hypothetical protein
MYKTLGCKGEKVTKGSFREKGTFIVTRGTVRVL